MVAFLVAFALKIDKITDLTCLASPTAIFPGIYYPKYPLNFIDSFLQ